MVMENLLDFAVAGPNLPFLIALAVVLAIAILEVISMLIGFGHITGSDIDFTADLNGNGIPDYLEVDHGGMFGWLNPGHVPSVILLILFAGLFAVFGFSGQWIYKGIVGDFAPAMVVAPIAVMLTLPILRQATYTIGRIVPQDETNAVTLDSLIGNIGVVNAGPVSKDNWGMARFTDKHGVDHNLLVGGEGEEIIANGDAVVLLDACDTKPNAFIIRKL